MVLQKYFEKKIKSVVNNSAEIAKNYVNETRNSIEADILLMVLDINSKSDVYYDNPQSFLKVSAHNMSFSQDEIGLHIYSLWKLLK